MRTNIVLDEELIKKAMVYSGAKTMRETIDCALREYVSVHSRANLRELVGKVQFQEGYDYKKHRESRKA